MKGHAFSTIWLICVSTILLQNGLEWYMQLNISLMSCDALFCHPHFIPYFEFTGHFDVAMPCFFQLGETFDKGQ